MCHRYFDLCVRLGNKYPRAFGALPPVQSSTFPWFDRLDEEISIGDFISFMTEDDLAWIRWSTRNPVDHRAVERDLRRPVLNGEFHRVPLSGKVFDVGGAGVRKAYFLSVRLGLKSSDDINVAPAIWKELHFKVTAAAWSWFASQHFVFFSEHDANSPVSTLVVCLVIEGQSVIFETGCGPEIPASLPVRDQEFVADDPALGLRRGFTVLKNLPAGKVATIKEGY